MSVLAKAWFKCQAGNKLAVVSDDMVWAWMKLLVGENGDPGFLRFEEVWFFKTSRTSSKKDHVGRQKFMELLNSHKSTTKAVSSRLQYCFESSVTMMSNNFLFQGNAFLQFKGNIEEVDKSQPAESQKLIADCAIYLQGKTIAIVYYLVPILKICFILHR